MTTDLVSLPPPPLTEKYFVLTQFLFVSYQSGLKRFVYVSSTPYVFCFMRISHVIVKNDDNRFDMYLSHPLLTEKYNQSLTYGLFCSIVVSMPNLQVTPCPALLTHNGKHKLESTNRSVLSLDVFQCTIQSQRSMYSGRCSTGRVCKRFS